MNRIGLAFRLFWSALFDPEFASRAEVLFQPTPTGPDLRILAVLQRDGRLVDFLLEDMDDYTDAQIGAGARDIHRGCRKVLKDYLAIEPVMPQAEGSRVSVPAGFDPSAIRLSGNVGGSPPFGGLIKHRGWRVTSARLPVLPGVVGDSAVLAPAEVEI